MKVEAAQALTRSPLQVSARALTALAPAVPPSGLLLVQNESPVFEPCGPIGIYTQDERHSYDFARALELSP